MATVELTRRLLGGDDPTADEQYVELLRDQSKWREALQAAREASVKYPGQRSLLWYQAATLTDLGRIDEGVALLRGQLKNTPEDVRSYIQISALYTQANRGAEAVAAARKALEQTPAANQKLQTIVLLSLSSAQEKAGDPRGSEESLRRVLSQEPNNAQALNNLGYFLIERNERLEEAAGMIQRALRADPFNSSYLDSLGWAYYKLGKLEEAERYLSDAARRSANSVAIQEHLGDVLLKRGKLAEARLAWQKALELSGEAAETSRLRAKLNTNKK
ncbi:MAG: tetratricopeptide repeat protein [Pyrinomonadaceae bacterium]